MQTIIPSPENQEVKILDIEDFQWALGEPLSEKLQSRIQNARLEYHSLTQMEREECIRVIVEKLMDDSLDKSGAHRIKKWESGWGENLDQLSKNMEWKKAIIPKYFDKYDVVRWKQNFIKVLDPDFEYKMLGLILDWLFEKYLSKHKTVYEFGCGTGHNLVRLQEWNEKANLWGLDWAKASQDSMAKLAELDILPRGHGRNFNFFEPDHSLTLDPGAAVYTVAALEQVGEKTDAFIEYLINQRPDIVVNLEPMAEFFDEKDLADFLAIQYYKKRNYLWGYLTKLREWERRGKIKIHLQKRTHLGHYLTDGYSFVVWSPVT